MKTADALYEIYNKGGKISPAMAMDLFGILNLPTHLTDEQLHDRMVLLDGLYKGLYLMEVPARKIEEHRRANTLDRLIHESYRSRSSGYYQRFCEQGIAIGPTHIF